MFFKHLQHISAACLLAGAVLVASPAAFAQAGEGAVRLSGSVQLGPELQPLPVLPEMALTSVPLQREAIASVAPVQASRPQAPDTGADTGTASALPWYERFTVAPSESYAVWGAAPREFQLQAGDRWGVTLGYSEGVRSAQDFSLDDFSAGAFFEFSERVRVGGELRFTSPEEEIFGEETERKTPELRFESAFRF